MRNEVLGWRKHFPSGCANSKYGFQGGLFKMFYAFSRFRRLGRKVSFLHVKKRVSFVDIWGPLSSSLFWGQIHYEVAILSPTPFQTLWQAFIIHYSPMTVIKMILNTTQDTLWRKRNRISYIFQKRGKPFLSFNAIEVFLKFFTYICYKIICYLIFIFFEWYTLPSAYILL